jgi:beta-galactosidase GanA
MPGQPFPYGASYSPLIFAESEWELDLAGMQQAGMNLVRIGDVHGSWDRIEPRPGEIQLDLLKRFYNVAHKHGIFVLLSTGASSPPLWLANIYPDVSILSSRGERYPLGASYHWACIHHPGFRLAAESYLHRLVSFTVEQENHFGWQISNEIGFPFMPAREKGDLGLYCYCEHCQAEFRRWLENKYNTLETLTHAWSWSTTNFVYTDWESVAPPESLPDSWSGVTRWLDWRQFWGWAFARFAGWQHKIIRQIDPISPTSVNTFNFKGFDRFGTYMGLDQWQIVKQVDHIGYDLYPGSGDKLKARPEHSSIFLDHGRSIAQSANSDFWIHEIESGPIGGWLLGPEHDTTDQDILNYTIECLGHNAKLLLYMPWREWHYQPIRWGALVELDGNPTPRLEAISALGKFIHLYADFLLESKSPAAEVAILESKPNAIFLRGVNQEEFLFAAQRGAYLAFWEQGLGVDFITPAQLSLPRLVQYRCICLPLLGLLNQEHARLLQNYVAQGGLLLGFARCGALDENGWYHHPLPIPELADVFGIQHLHAGTLAGQQILYNQRSYPSHLNRDELHLFPATQVLARFDDGLPAITLAAHGLGYGLYLATQADSGYAQGVSALLGDVVHDICQRFSINPVLNVISSPGRPRGVDGHLLEKEKRSMVLLSNYHTSALEVTLRIDHRQRKPATVEIIFPQKQFINAQISGELLEIYTKFQAKEVQVIEINWQ